MTSIPAELGTHRPALRAEVMLSPALLHGPRTVHLVKDPAGGASFEVGTKEYFLISRLDGERRLDDIGEEYARAFGRRLGEANWRQLLGMLGTRGLLAGSPLPAGTPATDPPQRTLRVTGGPLSGTLRLVSDAAATTGRLHRALRPVLRPAVLLPVLATVAAMEVVLALHVGELAEAALRLFRQPAALLAVCTLLWLSTALHELAHGVAARAFGGAVGEIGLRWRLPMVVMYCRVDNLLYLRSRRHQVVIAGAGAFMNLLFLLPFAAWWLALPPGDATRAVLAGLLLLGSVQGLVNLVPLPPLDGYAMLCHVLRISGYATESRRYLRLRMGGAGRHGDDLAAYPRRARIAYAAYGWGSAIGLLVLAMGLGASVYLLTVN